MGYAALWYFKRNQVKKMLDKVPKGTNLLAFLKTCTIMGHDEFLNSLTQSAEESLLEQVTLDKTFVHSQIEAVKKDPDTNLLSGIASDISTHPYVRSFMGGKNKDDAGQRDYAIAEIADQLSKRALYQP